MKKKTAITLILIGLFVPIIVFSYFYYDRYQKFQNNIDNSFSLVQNNSAQLYSMKGFLKSIDIVDQNLCLNVKKFNDHLEEVQFCYRKNLIEWENPYDDYSMLIPIQIQISYSNNLFNRYRIEAVLVDVLEDKDYIDFLHSMNKNLLEQTQIRITSLYKEIEQGYYFTKSPGSDTYDIFVIRDVYIKDILNKDIFDIYFTCNLKGQNKNIHISTDKIIISRIENGTDTLEEYSIGEEVEYSKTDKYQFFFEIPNGENVEELIVSEIAQNDYYSLDYKLLNIANY
jgi:hypothetical protein